MEKLSVDEIICPFCGNSIPKDSINCSLCGMKIGDPYRYSNIPPYGSKPIAAPAISPGSLTPQPPIPPRTKTSRRKLIASGIWLLIMIPGIIATILDAPIPIEGLTAMIVVVGVPAIVFIHHLFFPPRVSQTPELGGSSYNSRYIPAPVRRQVWARDGGRCVQCGSERALRFDHIIPFSKGGATTVENLQLLCANCNNLKRDRIDG